MGPEKKDYCRALGEVQPHTGPFPLLSSSLRHSVTVHWETSMGNPRLIGAACALFDVNWEMIILGSEQLAFRPLAQTPVYMLTALL